jgi:hypothetical protein
LTTVARPPRIHEYILKSSAVPQCFVVKSQHINVELYKNNPTSEKGQPLKELEVTQSLSLPITLLFATIPGICLNWPNRPFRHKYLLRTSSRNLMTFIANDIEIGENNRAVTQ